MGVLSEAFEKYLEEKKWIDSVKVKYHPPEGLFKDGSPEEIAKVICKDSTSLKQAVDRIVFFFNRYGCNEGGKRKNSEICKKYKPALEKVRELCKNKG